MTSGNLNMQTEREWFDIHVDDSLYLRRISSSDTTKTRFISKSNFYSNI